MHGFVAVFYVSLLSTIDTNRHTIVYTHFYDFHFDFSVFTDIFSSFCLLYNLFITMKKKSNKKSVSRCYIFRFFTLNFNLEKFLHRTVISRRCKSVRACVFDFYFFEKNLFFVHSGKFYTS